MSTLLDNCSKKANNKLGFTLFEMRIYKMFFWERSSTIWCFHITALAASMKTDCMAFKATGLANISKRLKEGEQKKGKGLERESWGMLN